MLHDRNRLRAGGAALAGADAARTSDPGAASLTRNAATRSFMAAACASSVFDVAAFSSTNAEFCCVASSICDSAVLT